MTSRLDWPLWLQDIQTTLPISAQFAIWGDVSGEHVVPTSGGSRILDTVQALWAALDGAGYGFLLVHDPADGLSVVPATREACDRAERVLASLKLSFDPGAPTEISTQRLPEVLKVMVSACEEYSLAVALRRPGRLTPDVANPTADAHAFFVKAERIAQMPHGGLNAAERLVRTSLFWLIDRESDLPHWFVSDNEASLRSLVIALPDRDSRLVVAEGLRDLEAAASADEAAVASAIEQLGDQSEGMNLVELRQVIKLARTQSMALDDIDLAVRAYRVGVVANPWRKDYLWDRVAAADGDDGIRSRVLGQDAAVTKSLDILKRSVLGLSGAQARSSANRPRGVLLFVGPTGTGKTELAKSLTELVFGAGAMPLRFDMSEFGADHSEARLMGAPPGYVGYDAGGELTNAIRRRPFSLVLFDEIDKAHPRILDKFLQILDEGRLTDGRGSTVSFQESILVFTSNAGMLEVNREVTAGGAGPDALPSFVDLQSRLKKAVKDDFTFRIQRPELLNRFGDNIVVFDFLRPPFDVRVFESLLGFVHERAASELGVDLSLNEDVRSKLCAACIGDPMMGGRGIANQLESLFVNPLARALFELGAELPARVLVNGWKVSEGVATVTLDQA